MNYSLLSADALNVLGEPLQLCGCSPKTGWLRDGFCHTDRLDLGQHTVCAVLTQAFLEYTLQQGNDLTTPRPEYQFPGLKAGDAWCLCASRWLQAYHAGVAPWVKLESTHQQALAICTLEQLQSHAFTTIVS
ncbi:MAG: DUF2237 family protein [Vampirovibrionales bacterium]